jgi:D-alanyl-lipoteichoic acid acyltransferase DltB (MBOAT superfamily)
MSGPITRAKEFYSYLNNPTLLSYSQGRIITLILSGLIKKYVIASYLFDFVSAPFATPTNYARTDLVLAAFAYSILLYVDFSGYSDFAIAISNLLGFNVEANFNKPYSSIGLKDFWNRWHISLSLWFKDYVYIPLGGSRKGKIRKYWNIMVTMFISGLWHGAGWNFIIWGILHGVGSVVSHIVSDFFGVKESSKVTHSVSETSLHGQRMVNHDFHANEVPFYKKTVLFIMKSIGWAITYIYITFAWIFFNSANLGNAVNFIVAMFSSNVVELKTYDIRVVGVIVIVLLTNFLGDKLFKNISKFFDSIPLVVRIPFITVIVYLILQLGPTTMPPFIYFNF